MPYKIEPRSGRFLVIERLPNNRRVIRANKETRKEAEEWIETEG